MIKKLLLPVLLFSFYIGMAQEPDRSFVPDDIFEQALINWGYDDVLDNYVLTSNIINVTEIDFNNSNLNNVSLVEDLTGIEKFTALKKLGLYSLQSLTSLDVTNNKNLEELDISETGIRDINLSQNVALQTFYAHDTRRLERIDLSKNLALKTLFIQWAPITEIDVSNNLDLEELTVWGVGIDKIDVSNNMLLRTLIIEDNSITEINLSTNIALERLGLSGNELKSLDLTNNTALKALYAENNPLTCIQVADVNAANQIQETRIDDEDIFSTNCNDLSDTRTYIPDDQFELALINFGYDNVLDDYVLTANIQDVTDLLLDEIFIQDFTGIEDFLALEALYSYRNSFTSIDLSKNTKLKSLLIAGGELTTIDLSKNTDLEELDLSDQSLEAIDLSANTKLRALNLTNGKFSEIDLSKNVLLQNLYLSYSNIEEINLSNLTNLKFVFLDHTAIETLDLSQNKLLQTLWLQDSKISAIDLSLQPDLRGFWAFNTPNLNCIQVSDVTIANEQAGWRKDDSDSYSEDCAALCEDSGICPNTCTASGTILMERYEGISGSAISDLLGATNYPDTPSLSSELTSFEIQRNQGDKYGVRVSGYLCPPETGTYYFYIAGNNHTELNLSTTDDSADKVRIAHHESYASNRQWDKFATQKSSGILLQQGKRYYIEGLMKEASAGDNLAVGWRKPSEGDGMLASEVIPGSVLSPVLSDFIPVTGITVSPTQRSISEEEIVPISTTISPWNASYRSLTWVTSDASIASVDSNGRVKGISQGTATITVKTTDGGFTAQTDILVLPGNANTCNASGTILMERYDEIGGSSISNLLNATNYPDNPSSSSDLSIFEIPKNQGDNYGARVSGYLCPPETGTYYFWIAGNNSTELNLSTTANKADKVRIAHHGEYTSNRQWRKFSSQRSLGIYLTKGNTYYIEALMKEDAFGDNLAVAWRKPSDGIGIEPAEVIPGSVLSPSAITSKSLTIRVSDLQAENEPKLTISPNPATTVVNIVVSNFVAVSEIEYTIYTLSGSEVISLKGSSKQTIDISSLAKGTYQLVARSGAWSKGKNLIIR